jgi:hypothetical protein
MTGKLNIENVRLNAEHSFHLICNVKFCDRATLLKQMCVSQLQNVCHFSDVNFPQRPSLIELLQL